MKARLLVVTFGLFVVIASVGQCLYWVTTRTKSETPRSMDLAQLKGQSVTSNQRSYRLLSPTKKNPPMASGEVVKAKPEFTAPSKIEKVARPPLIFKKVRVMGRLASPRLDFAQGSLPVERVDEPLRQEFFQKVFSPVGDYSF
ncbi:MAG: hypothetical protein FJ146_03315 [Deltaproteobacteria bacterium]|nr:hypothetical protein [Deltaproteobacteria bacterium]